MISCISYNKNIIKIPDYAYVVETYDHIWKEAPGTRYPPSRLRRLRTAPGMGLGRRCTCARIPGR